MNFDANEPQSKPKFEPLPTAWYAAMAEEARDEEAKSSGKPRTAVTFKVAVRKKDGTFYFRKVFMNYAWHNSEQKSNLRKLVEACGYSAKGSVDPALLVGRNLEVYLTTKIDATGAYPDKNEVSNVRPAPGQAAPPPPPAQANEYDPENPDSIPF